MSETVVEEVRVAESYDLTLVRKVGTYADLGAGWEVAPQTLGYVVRRDYTDTPLLETKSRELAFAFFVRVAAGEIVH